MDPAALVALQAVLALVLLGLFGFTVYAVGNWGPNVVRTALASRFWFYAKVGEMQALAIERFGEFYRMFISAKGLRYEEFRGYCNSRNFKHLKDNGLLPAEYAAFTEYDRPSKPADLTPDEDKDSERHRQHRDQVAQYELRLKLFKEMEEYLEKKMRDYKDKDSRVPYVLLHADREDRNQPVYIGRPWEVKPRFFAETREQTRFTPYLDLNVRAVHVPKETKAPEGSTFFVPSVPDKNGVVTAFSLSLIIQVHGPYEAIYNVDFYVHTLLNQIIPYCREAVAGEAWQPGELENGRTGKRRAAASITPANSQQKAIQATISRQVRVRLKLWQDKEGQEIWWNRDKSDGQEILRYPKDNDGPMAWAYRNTGVYTHDVVVQDIEAPHLEATIETITSKKFGARATIEEAKGSKRKLQLEGEGRAYAEQKRIQALSAYKQVAEKTGIAASEVLRQDTLAKVADRAEPMIISSGGREGLDELVARTVSVASKTQAKPPRKSTAKGTAAKPTERPETTTPEGGEG